MFKQKPIPTEWGPWIDIHYTKPEWIKIDDIFQYRTGSGYSPPLPYYGSFFDWWKAKEIRLGHDHPIYSNPYINPPPVDAEPRETLPVLTKEMRNDLLVRIKGIEEACNYLKKVLLP